MARICLIARRSLTSRVCASLQISNEKKKSKQHEKSGKRGHSININK